MVIRLCPDPTAAFSNDFPKEGPELALNKHMYKARKFRTIIVFKIIEHIEISLLMLRLFEQKYSTKEIPSEQESLHASDERLCESSLLTTYYGQAGAGQRTPSVSMPWYFLNTSKQFLIC